MEKSQAAFARCAHAEEAGWQCLWAGEFQHNCSWGWGLPFCQLSGPGPEVVLQSSSVSLDLFFPSVIYIVSFTGFFILAFILSFEM